MATVRKPVFPPRPTNPEAHKIAGESEALAFLRATTEPSTFGTLVSISPIPGADKKHTCTGLGYTSDTLAAAQVFIDAAAAAKLNLYWSPNPVRSHINKKPAKADIAAMRYAHLDVDDPSDETLARLREYPLPPTTIVFSGGGYNAYWKLAKPVLANGNLEILEAANKKLIVDLGGDVGTHNLDRILRLPGTTNFPSPTKIKRGRVPIEAHLIEHFPERTYTLDELMAVEVTAADAKVHAKSEPKAKSVTKSTDRSRDLLKKISEDVREGCDDAEIHARRDQHPHATDQEDGARAVQRCIDKVRRESQNIIGVVNARNALIFINGKFLVLWPEIFDGGLPRLSSIPDMKSFWKTHQRGKVSPIDLWLGSGARREYERFVFRPGIEDTGKNFNLFRGWGVEPNPQGDCSLFLEHIRSVICAGDADQFEYVTQWLANIVQRPEDKPGTGLAIRSGQGAGKGALKRYLAPIFDRHMLHLAGSEILLGRFNDALAGKLLVFGDEACWPGDRRGVDKLKSYITESEIFIDRKNVPAFSIDLHARFIFATNASQSAPVELDDRRFVPLTASNKRVGDFAYWEALEAERRGTGPAALLHYLLNVQLTRNLRETPKTKELLDQKLQGLDDLGRFARELLMRAKHSLDLGTNLETGGRRTALLEFDGVADTKAVHVFYLDFCKRNQLRFPRSVDALAIGLRRYFQLTKREARADEKVRWSLEGKRVRVYALPTLLEARKSFEKALGGPVEWPGKEVSRA